MLSRTSQVALGKLGVLVSSVCKTEIMHVKIRWCVSIWDNAWHWIDTRSRDLCVTFGENLVYVWLLSYNTCVKALPAFWKLHKGGCICAHLGSPVCLLLVLTPQGLRSGRERSVQTVVRGGKFSAAVLPLKLVFVLVIVLSACSSQATDCEVFCFIIIALLLKMTSPSRGRAVTCSGSSWPDPSTEYIW